MINNDICNCGINFTSIEEEKTHLNNKKIHPLFYCWFCDEKIQDFYNNTLVLHLENIHGMNISKNSMCSQLMDYALKYKWRFTICKPYSKSRNFRSEFLPENISSNWKAKQKKNELNIHWMIL